MTTQRQWPRWQQVLAELGKAACYLGLFLGWQMLVSTIYTSVITVKLMTADFFVDQRQIYDAVMASSMEISFLSGLLTLGSVAVLFKLRRRNLRRELWLRPVPGVVLGWCSALAFCLFWLVLLLLACLPEQWMNNYAEASASLEQTGLMAVLAAVLVGPVVEEVIFRGLIFTRLRRAMPGWMAVVLSAAIFGVCHGNYIWFCYAFLMGAIFALLVERTHSILPGMFMHVVFNGTNELLTLLEDWEPGMAAMLVIVISATAGTVFCTLRVRGAVSRIPERFVVVEQQTVTAQAGLEPDVPQRPTVQVRRSGRAEWDPDSGPHHKFPPVWR